MNIFKLTLLSFILFAASPLLAGSGTGPVTVDRITTWKNGDFKVYLKEKEKVDGKESCTATDGSVALVSNPASHAAESNILKRFMLAKMTESRVTVYVHGCCKSHNRKESPCIRTVANYVEPRPEIPEVEETPEPVEPEIVTQFVPTLSAAKTPAQACGNLIPVGCISGETRLADVGSITFPYGTWGGVSQYGTIAKRMDTIGYNTSRLAYCYRPGQKQDNDRTDIVVGYVCKSEGAPLTYTHTTRRTQERRTGDDR